MVYSSTAHQVQRDIAERAEERHRRKKTWCTAAQHTMSNEAEELYSTRDTVSISELWRKAWEEERKEGGLGVEWNKGVKVEWAVEWGDRVPWGVGVEWGWSNFISLL